MQSSDRSEMQVVILYWLVEPVAYLMDRESKVK